MATPIHMLEHLLGDCVRALVTLLASPDLNLDCLEPATREAIAQAHTVLQAVDAAGAPAVALPTSADGPGVPRPS